MLLFGAKPTVNTVFVAFMAIVTAKCEGLFFLVLFGFNDVNVLRTGRNVLGACPPIADDDVGPLTAVDMVRSACRNPCRWQEALAAPPPRPSKRRTTYQASNKQQIYPAARNVRLASMEFAEDQPIIETQRDGLSEEIVDKKSIDNNIINK